LPKLKPEDLVGVKNDTGLSNNDVAKILADGVELKWQKLAIVIDRGFFDMVHTVFNRTKAQYSHDKLAEATETVLESLELAYKMIQAGKHTKELMDNFVLDLCVLHAMRN
jgi:hypothetical protein